MQLQILRDLAKGDTFRSELLAHDESVAWYNTVSITTPSYISSRMARAIALYPKIHIIYIDENVTMGRKYRKILTCLLLLLDLCILEVYEYQHLSKILEDSIISFVVYRNNFEICFTDGSYYRFNH